MILQFFFRVFPLLFCLCFPTSPALGAFALFDTHPASSTVTYATPLPAGLTGLALGRRDPGRAADIINITLSYTQAGRALAKMRYGILDSGLKGTLSMGRWLPQRMTTSWDRLVSTPLHTWTDAFFPQLQPQLALASGGLGRGHFSGLMPQSTRGTTFKMDGKGFGGGRSGTHKPSLGKMEGRGGKTSNFQKNDLIGLERFTERLPRGEWRDPKTNQIISPDKARSSSGGGHGGSYWKLKDKHGKRLGTISSDGRWLRR